MRQLYQGFMTLVMSWVKRWVQELVTFGPQDYWRLVRARPQRAWWLEDLPLRASFDPFSRKRGTEWPSLELCHLYLACWYRYLLFNILIPWESFSMYYKGMQPLSFLWHDVYDEGLRGDSPFTDNASLCSLCLPTALIPILKLSSSTHVMSTEFQVSNTLYTICWMLAAVVIGFDIFLFSTYLHAIPSVWVAVLLGISYLVSDKRPPFRACPISVAY